jgi:hypothetical protein
MITLYQFRESVYEHFKFLETLFGYKKLQQEESSLHFRISYQKGDIVVEIAFSKKNIYIDVSIYNNVSSFEKLTTRDSKNSVDLIHIIHSKNKDLDYKIYNAAMPSKIDLDASLKKLAEWTKDYATNYLEGKEWKGWGELTGYEKPTSFEMKVYIEGKLVVQNPAKE